MEAGTAPGSSEKSTGSRTIADLALLAAEKHGDKVAMRHKSGDGWADVTYREFGEAVSEIGRGFLDLGLEPGDRVSLLAQTRPEWTTADFGISSAGGTVVPIYPTNSAEECEWVAGNSESRFVVCEDATQLAKIAEVRERLPQLEQLVVIDGSGDVGDAITLDELRERGRGRGHEELVERAQSIPSDQPFTFIYTSGTTGPPKGCVLTHGNYRDVLNMCAAIDVVEDDELVYLFLPLAHSFALLVQLLTIDLGGTLAYYGGDTKQVIPELMEIKPTYLPSVPRIFEKLYTKAQELIPAEQIAAIRDVGGPIRDAEVAGTEPPADLLERWNAPIAGDPQGASLAGKAAFVQNLFGGRLRQAVTGAAPIAKEILEFFWACGVPVLEGYGMTETSTVSTYSTVEHHKFGTVGRPLPGCEVRIAEDGEILVKGANIFQGYYKMEDQSFGAIEDGWLHTGDLGSIDDEGYVSITGRKKDIIITAGGKNLTPANLENHLKQSRWISQAVMYGDRRPYPVALITLDPEEIAPWAEQQGLATDLAQLCKEPKVHELVQGIVDEVNRHYAQVEQIKRFMILDHDLSQETGELTPTLKVKRNVVYEQYADDFDALYAGGSA
jgi:long-chain acyl-CoA synthetase